MQEKAQPIVDSYADTMMDAYTGRMARKMGLTKYDKDVAVGLVTLMYEDKADFTNTFRALASVCEGDAPGSIPAPLEQVKSCHRQQESVQVALSSVHEMVYQRSVNGQTQMKVVFS